MRVTLKDLAAHLNLSQATVSRGLRGDPHFPVETRKRIEEAAEKLGYRPNALMSELASRRWQTAGASSGSIIAYIYRNMPGGDIGFPEELLSSPAQSYAESLGYGFEVFNRFEYDSSSQLEKVLRSRGITDLILGPVYDKSLLTELDWSKFICIQLIPGHFHLPLHSVIEDEFKKVLVAWRKAVICGYQRIGFVLLDHQIELMDDVMRLAGVHACQKNLSPQLPALEPFLYLRHDERRKNFIQWCRKNRPDVIIGFNEVHFYHFRNAFDREIPYVALHKTSLLNFTGIVNERSAAREGINLLHLCRRTHQWGIPKQRIDHVIEPTWFEGDTLPIKKSALNSGTRQRVV